MKWNKCKVKSYLYFSFLCIFPLFNIYSTELKTQRFFVEIESSAQLQRYPYFREWNDGWYSREFSCRGIPAPGMGWAAMIHNNIPANKSSLVCQLEQTLPVGKVKIFLRVLHPKSKKGKPKIEVRMGGSQIQFEWGKGKQFKWTDGKILELKRSTDQLELQVLRYGSPVIGVLYNPLRSLVCIDSAYITSDLSEMSPPSKEKEKMIKAGIIVRDLAPRDKFMSDDSSVYNATTPIPLEKPFVKPIYLSTLPGRKNHWPNASLELGMNDGWASQCPGKVRHVFTDQDLKKNDPFHGEHALSIKGHVGAFSRPHYLNKTQEMTFSLYARGSGKVKAELRKINDIRYRPGKPFTFDRGLEKAIHFTIQAEKKWRRGFATSKLKEGWYYLYIKGDHDFELDGIQLEEGHQASSFQTRAIVEGAIRTGQLANIIYLDQQKSMTAWFHNSSPETIKTQLNYRIVDHRESTILNTSSSIRIPGNATKKINISLPLKNGIFSILYGIQGDDRSFPEGETVYVTMPTPHTKTTRHELGANMSYSEDELAVHARAGFKWVLTCKSREITEGRYMSDGTFNYRDDLASLPKKYGLGLIPNFWPKKTLKNMMVPIEAPYRKFRNGKNDKKPIMNKWKDMVRKAAVHYQPYVKIWCIEDEMEFSQWDPKTILPYLDSAIDIVKASAPTVRLGISGDPDYVEELIALGFNPRRPDYFGASQFEYTYWKSDKTKYQKELYQKEFISYGVGGRPPANTMYHTRYAYFPAWGKILHMARQVIKGYLVQDLKVVGHYASIFRNNGVHLNTNKPLFDYDGTPIPWGATFFIIGNFLSEALPGPTYYLGNSDRLVHSFQLNGEEWATTCSMNTGSAEVHWKPAWRNIHIHLNDPKKEIKVYDMFFNEIKNMTRTKTQLALKVGQEPLFFNSTTLSRKNLRKILNNAKISPRPLETSISFIPGKKGNIDALVTVKNNTKETFKDVNVDLRYPKKKPWNITASTIFPLPHLNIKTLVPGKKISLRFPTIVDMKEPFESGFPRIHFKSSNGLDLAFDQGLWMLPAHRVSESLKLDGKLNEWKKYTAAWLAYEWCTNTAGRGQQQFYKNARYFNYPIFRLDARASIWAGNDSNYLYLAIKLEDDQLMLPNETLKIILRGQNKSLVLQLKPKKDGSVDIQGNKKGRITAICSTTLEVIENGTDNQKKEFTFLGIEVRIPKKLLGTNLTNNTIAGFDLFWTDADHDGKDMVKGTLRWAAQSQNTGYLYLH